MNKEMMKEKTYTEFRQSFNSVKEFNEALGKLTEEEARALISAEEQPVSIKACMMATWKSSREDYLRQEQQSERKQ